MIVMNYIDGSNLQNKRGIIYYKNYQSIITSAENKYIACEICKGVHYMHHHVPVIIHQDLKPLNVLVIAQRMLQHKRAHNLQMPTRRETLSHSFIVSYCIDRRL